MLCNMVLTFSRTKSIMILFTFFTTNKLSMAGIISTINITIGRFIAYGAFRNYDIFIGSINWDRNSIIKDITLTIP